MIAKRRRPVEAAGSGENARSAFSPDPWKTLRVSHSSHRPDDRDDKLIHLSTESGECHTTIAVDLAKNVFEVALLSLAEDLRTV